MGNGKVGNGSWFLGMVLMLLVVAGVEVNPGLLMEQEKIDQILKQVKN
jgi:hypothetical protein